MPNIGINGVANQSSVDALEHFRDRAVEAEKLLEGVHNHLVNCEDKIDALGYETCRSNDDFHSHITTIDANVRFLKAKLIARARQAKKPATRDVEEMPELKKID